MEAESRVDGLHAAWHAWQLLAQKGHKRRLLQHQRAGAPKGHLAWESTSTISGVQVITQIAHETGPLTQVPLAELSRATKGFATCLIKSWTERSQEDTTVPQALIFPGRCSSILRRLGANQERLTETEVIVQDPEHSQQHRRHVTVLLMTDGKYTYGANVTEVAAPLETSLEVVAEVDARWATNIIINAINNGGRATIARMMGQLTQTVVAAEAVYFNKVIGEASTSLWTAALALHNSYTICGQQDIARHHLSTWESCSSEQKQCPRIEASHAAQ